MKLICKCPKKNGTTPRLHVNFFNGDTHCGVSEKKKLKIIQPFGRKIVSLRLDNFLQSAIHVAILLYFVSQTCND